MVRAKRERRERKLSDQPPRHRGGVYFGGGLVHKATLALWVHYFGFPLTSRTRLNRMSDKESKKSPKPPQRVISLGMILSNIAVGPLGFRAELATDTKSEQSRSYRDLEADGTDSAVMLDKDTEALRIVSQENKDEDQRLVVTEVSTPGAVVGGTEYGNDPTSERI